MTIHSIYPMIISILYRLEEKDMECPKCKSSNVVVINRKTIKDSNGNIVTLAMIQCNDCYVRSTIEIIE